MARWRKIGTGIWGSPSFAALTTAPCGKFLFLYLCCGPHTTPLPGISCAGEAGLAEALGWPLKAFREAFAEASREGMVEADWNRRVVVVWKALQHNHPESPNVVKSWAAHWGDIPACELKYKYYQHLKAFLEGFGEAFREAFRQGFREGVSTASPTPFGESVAVAVAVAVAGSESKDLYPLALDPDSEDGSIDLSLKEVSPSTEAPSKKKPNVKKPATLPDEEWFEELGSNPAYQHIDLTRELGKIDAWLALPQNKGRIKSRKFILNWLNKVESPVRTADGKKKGDGKWTGLDQKNYWDGLDEHGNFAR